MNESSGQWAKVNNIANGRQYRGYKLLRIPAHLQLFKNGYAPLPNKGKVCFSEGWPKIKIDEKLINSSTYKARGSMDIGLRCSKLVAIDYDIDNAGILEGLDEYWASAGIPISRFVCTGKSPRIKRLYRTTEPAAKSMSGQYGRNKIDGVHQEKFRVEVLSAGSQIGAFGQHSRGTYYGWADLSPLDHHFDDLPELTLDQRNKMLEMAEDYFKGLGLEDILPSRGAGGTAFSSVYDLEPEMVIPTEDGDMTVQDLTDTMTTEKKLRCDMSWARDEAENPSSGSITYHEGGYISITDFGADTTHYPAVMNAFDTDPDRLSKVLSAAMKQIKDVKKEAIALFGTPLDAPEEPEPLDVLDGWDGSLDKLLKRYALCATESVIIDVYKPLKRYTMIMFNELLREYTKPHPMDKTKKPLLLANAWRSHPDRIKVDGVRFMPGEKSSPLHRDQDGMVYINTYKRPVFPEGGSAGVGFEFMKHLIPDPLERDWFLRWLARLISDPSMRGPCIIFVADRVFGTGRASLGKFIRLLLGGYVAEVKFSTLTGSSYQSQYNAYRIENSLVFINEARDPDVGNWKSSAKAFEYLKEEIELHPKLLHVMEKGIRNYHSWDTSSTIIATNHQDMLALPANDRRFAILSNGLPLSIDLRDRFHAWMDNPQDLGAFTKELSAKYLSDFDPFGMPIQTDAKDDMVEAAKSPIDKYLEDFLKQAAPKGRFVCFPQLKAFVDTHAHDDSATMKSGWEDIMTRMLTKDTDLPFGKEGDNRVSVSGKQIRYRALRGKALKGKEWPREEILKELGLNGSFAPGYQVGKNDSEGNVLSLRRKPGARSAN